MIGSISPTTGQDMRTMRRLLILSITTVLAACGGDKENDSDSQTVNLSPLGKSLQGTWVKSSCSRKKGSDSSFKLKAKFTANKATAYSTEFSSSDCSGDEFARIEVEYKYKIGESVLLGSGLEPNKIALFDGQRSLKLLSDAAVKDYNGRTVCDKTDWKKDIDYNILSCDELFFDANNQGDLVLIKNGFLYLGDDDSKKDDLGYPTKLNSEFLFRE